MKKGADTCGLSWDFQLKLAKGTGDAKGAA
jgi:hypothetical protein